MPKVADPFAELMAGAEKKYGLTVGSMEDVVEGTKSITTGNLALDYAIGVGGIPLGRSIELYGLPSSGKTTTALQIIAALQKIQKEGGDEERGIKPDDIILYLDYEQAMDKSYAKALGVDTSKEGTLKFTQPDTLEDGVNFAIAAVKTDKVRLLIFDSVAAMNPSAKAEAEIGKSLPAVQAKLMKDFTVSFNSVLKNHNATALFLNHQMVSMVMGGRPGMPPPTTTPGGVALKYFASLRLQYSVVKPYKASVFDPVTRQNVERVMSSDVKVKVTKNKVAPPFREVILRVRFGKGFDNFATALQVLIANKKIMYSAGRYYFHNLFKDNEEFAPDWMPREKTGTNRPTLHGESAVYGQADEHPEWRQLLITAAEEIVATNQDTLAEIVPVGDEDEPEDDADLAELSENAEGNRVEL